MTESVTHKCKNYSYLGIIDSGTFSTCYKVINKGKGLITVWKAIDYGWMSEEDRELLLREVEMLSNINHPNIVQFYSHVNNKLTSNVYIEMEYCKHGSLLDLIKKHIQSNSYFKENFIWEVLLKLLDALKWLDVKTPNMKMINCSITSYHVFLDKSSDIKLGGFYLNENVYHKYNIAIDMMPQSSLCYMSPEVLGGEMHTRNAVVWSVGCLIHELACLDVPFSGGNSAALLENIKSGVRQRVPICFTQDLQKIVDVLLEPNHKMRPLIDDLHRHPIIESNSAVNSMKQLYIEKEKKVEDKENVQTRLVKRRICSNCIDLQLKLNMMKQKEAAIKFRECRLKERELSLAKREKKVALMEKLKKEKFMMVGKCFERDDHITPSECGSLNASSLSGDVGDVSLPATSIKLDPSQIVRPNFFLRDVTQKSVRFKGDRKGESYTEAMGRQPLRSKQYAGMDKNRRSIKDEQKEKMGTYFSLNKERIEGFLETHFV